MQHFANFGIVKRANKLLKRNAEISSKSAYTPLQNGLGQYAENIVNPPRPYISKEAQATAPSRAKNYIDSKLKGDRLRTKEYSQMQGSHLNDPLTLPYTSKTTQKAELVNKDGWSDVRRTSDDATSETGLLGFRTDPYKGFGGMMEEGIPFEDVVMKNSKKWSRGQHSESPVGIRLPV